MEFRLIQEDYQDDWQVVVCCIVLNRTSGATAIPVIRRILEECPTPLHLATMPNKYLAGLLAPCGMANVKSSRLRGFCRDYMSKKRLADCHGVGRYALDAVHMVCDGGLSYEPGDRQLSVRWRGGFGRRAI